MNVYDYSVKRQQIAAKKVYSIDTGLVNAIGFSFSSNTGRLVENAAFLALRRKARESYWAYADYLQVMELTEQMVRYTVQQALGTQTVVYQGHTLDFGPAWQRIELSDGIEEITGIDIHEHLSSQSLGAAMRARDIPVDPNATRGKLIDALLSDYLRPALIQPAFVYNYPRDISLLAKGLPGNPQVVERFEGYVAGIELCNAFTELNDPLDQERRFLEMGRDYADEDEERHPMDEDYLQAMRYGMPPTAASGWAWTGWRCC